MPAKPFPFECSFKCPIKPCPSRLRSAGVTVLAHVLDKLRLLPKWREADGLQKWLIAIAVGFLGAFVGLLIARP
jgi:hypothetical protein